MDFVVPPFDVHNYSLGGSAQPQPQSLLHTAHELLLAASSKSLLWASLSNVSSSINLERSSKSMVQYPLFNESTLRNQSVIENKRIHREWGTPILDQDDIFCLANLEEFRATDLSFVLNARLKYPHSDGPIASLPESPSPDEGSLHKVIPQPHIHPSSFANSLKPVKLIPFLKRPPILLPPRTKPFSPSPYGRTAWLVPIRGKFPWEQCTAAVVLNSSGLEVPYLDATKKHQIIWTYDSLQSFWAFLLEIKAKGTAGAIGLSFHASNKAALTSQPSNRTPAAIRGNPQVSTTPSKHGGSIKSTVRPPSAMLSTVDHFKIYHEAPNAMHLRNVLHLWSHVVPGDTEEQPPEKIRVLKGAILALVDERSQGILLS